jgi:hypothetical protein
MKILPYLCKYASFQYLHNSRYIFCDAVSTCFDSAHVKGEQLSGLAGNCAAISHTVQYQYHTIDPIYAKCTRSKRDTFPDHPPQASNSPDDKTLRTSVPLEGTEVREASPISPIHLRLLTTGAASLPVFQNGFFTEKAKARSIHSQQWAGCQLFTDSAGFTPRYCPTESVLASRQ